MHSRPRLAWLQMERQRGKGTGCHNLASHSGQERQLQTQTRRNQASTHACISPHRCSGRKHGCLEPNAPLRPHARWQSHGWNRAAGGRGGGGAGEGQQLYPTHFSPTWVSKPTSAKPAVWIPACCQPEKETEGQHIFLSVFLTFCFLLLQ